MRVWISSAPHGSPVYVPASGTIMSHSPHGTFQGDAATYIRLDNGMTVAYMHHALDPNLKSGSRVEAGQVIGTSGTANSVLHLHFETWAALRIDRSFSIRVAYSGGTRRAALICFLSWPPAERGAGRAIGHLVLRPRDRSA